MATGANTILVGQNNSTPNNPPLNNNNKVLDPLFFPSEEIERPVQHTHSKKRHVEEEAPEQQETGRETSALVTT
ncbi:18947_t:CDS:2 [Dentiscutata erythropus]|uniref:18947_t:CDS:1 n=1 Tax=Dentiscutata erythropus TaxID=1348616 RepID=A0A9N9CSV0_9GLOM|nr:18947_t:CDS:2 [Dentiscutata erythropus]